MSSSPSTTPSALERFFAFIVAKRWIWVALYAVLLPPSAYFATKVGQDNSIERLMVPTDPDFIATREFQKVFGGGEYAVLLAEADDPFDPAVLQRVDAIERAVAKVPKVSSNSAISVYRRAKAGFDMKPDEVAAFKKFITGTKMFEKQGLAGEHYIAVALVFDVADKEERAKVLTEVDKAVDEAGGGTPPLKALRRVGQPYVLVHLDEATRTAGPKYFGLFGAFVVLLTVSLYRSVRTLIAFLVTLGVCLSLSVGYIGLTGGNFTIVSPMVPMTILVTAMATLVYLQSRFVDRPASRTVDEHQIFSLANKFVACTASIFATVVGFAALAVSDVRPIKDMGIWVAVGLVLTFLVVFTLFPALQKLLKTPTAQEQKTAGQSFVRFTEWLPRASFKHRIALVAMAVVLMGCGAVGLFGIPGKVEPMQLLIDPVEYISHDSQLYRDTKRIEEVLPGLGITEVWLKGKKPSASVTEPKVLDGLGRFAEAVEADKDVGAAVGPIGILRMMRYISGQGDTFPSDPATLDEMAGDVEGLLPREPMLGRFITKKLDQTHLAVISHAKEDAEYKRLDKRLKELWAETAKKYPALDDFEMRTVGLGPLQAKMSQNLVPTLVESFAITIVIIFLTFVVVFRSGAARVMTMIPSLFAILVMFLVMRLTGMRLNVATILIATTVLGTSENDQIHFFYHFLERRKDGTVEQALRHTLFVSGKAIFFATLINAGGFLAFALSDLPPMKQFGQLTAIALLMSMVADFTALPAALWLVFREKPDAETKPAQASEG